jgi:hypothetical protein
MKYEKLRAAVIHRIPPWSLESMTANGSTWVLFEVEFEDIDLM